MALSLLKLGRRNNFTTCINFIFNENNLETYHNFHSIIWNASQQPFTHSQYVHVMFLYCHNTFQQSSGGRIAWFSHGLLSWKTRQHRTSSNPCFFFVRVPAQITVLLGYFNPSVLGLRSLENSCTKRLRLTYPRIFRFQSNSNNN